MKEWYLLKKWKEDTKSKIKLVYPEMDDDKIDKYLEEVISKNFKDRSCRIVNSYKNQEVDTTLLNMIQFIHDHKPITAGFGVLFKNQETSYSPASGLLLESIKTRSELKAKRKTYDKRSYEFLMLDIGQGNEKVVANSFYGASGAKTSIFYNKDLAASVTATGQAEISTAMTSFESLLANNVKFYDMDECMTFINNVLSKKKYKHEIHIPENIKDLALNKIVDTFFNENDINIDMLDKIFSHLSKEEMAKIYYVNNIKAAMLDFTRINKLLVDLICNTVEFRNPNEVPKEIHDKLKKLWEYIEEFCVYDFPVRNRIERDATQKRKVVVVQDTDSNMLTLNSLMDFMANNFTKGKIKANSDDDFDFILVNICCYILTRYSELFLKRYCTDVNIPKDYHWMIANKNEFYYPILITVDAKKHYLTLTKLQEGKEIDPPKIEIHGLDLTKAETSEKTEKFFNDLIKDEIMYSKHINVSNILKKIRQFEIVIETSLRSGKLDYLPLKSVKELGGYKDPYKEQGVKAVYIWNQLFTEMQINLPEKVLALKLTLAKYKDYEDHKNEIPEMYHDIIENDIFQSDKTSIAKGGFSIIALPQNLDKIPDWIIPFINYKKIVEDNVSKFNSILKSLGSIILKSKSTNTHISNLIDL